MTPNKPAPYITFYEGETERYFNHYHCLPTGHSVRWEEPLDEPEPNSTTRITGQCPHCLVRLPFRHDALHEETHDS